MTLCTGMKARHGLVGMADHEVTSGSERITVRKLTLHERSGHCIHVSQWWQTHLRQGVETCPSDWIEGVFSTLGGKIVPFDPASAAE